MFGQKRIERKEGVRRNFIYYVEFTSEVEQATKAARLTAEDGKKKKEQKERNIT